MAKSLYETVLHALIGPIDEWTSAEIDQCLTSAGIDVDSAKRHLCDRINVLADSYRTRNTDVPEHITECLRQLRPVEQPKTGTPCA